MGITRGRGVFRLLFEYAALILVLAVMIAFFGLKCDNFWSMATFKTIANQTPEIAIIAVGMTFVLIIGGIDLSVGAVLCLSGGVIGVALMKLNLPVAAALPLGVLVGSLCGFVNGALIVRWSLPSFIVTLGAMEAWRGAAHYVMNSQTQYIGERIEFLSRLNIQGFSMLFFFSIFLVIVAQVILSHTPFGRRMLAIGANEESARLSGAPVTAVRIAVFTISGFLAGLESIVNCSRMASANPNAGNGYELQAIAAVVIGGTSLLGGRGSVVNTFLGVAIMAVLETGLTQLDVSDPVKRMVTGIVIVLAVIADYYRHRRASGARV